MNAQTFLDYTARFDGLMQDLPSATGDRLDVFENPPQSDAKLRRWLLRYVNMCSEEYSLWDSRMLAKRVWKIWEKEIVASLSSPLVRQEWLWLGPHYDSFPEFKSWIEALHKESRR